jgi:hypothetical protein
MTRKLVMLGVLLQGGHFTEHLIQAVVWIWGDRTQAYMSPLAHVLAMWAGAPFGANHMAIGMEILHLAGNLAFLATLWGMSRLDWSPAIGWALTIEGYHLGEHISLTTTVITLGHAVGQSTLFGVGFRVWWHFVMNAIPTALMMVHVVQTEA